jgi:argininosuccinate lyase
MVMIEEHVEGPEYSVELFGDAMAAVVAKHLGPAPYFVEIGHDVPAELAGEDQQALTGVARQAIAALELGFGAAHVEMRLTATGPVLIEVNPRLAGGMIPELVHSATGVDLVSAQIAAAIGQTPRLDRGKAAYASLRFLTVDEPGVLVSDRVPAAAAAGVPGVREARLYRARGDRLDPAHDFRDRIGHVWSVASCAQDSRAAAGAGLELLRAAVRPVHDQGVRP